MVEVKITIELTGNIPLKYLDQMGKITQYVKEEVNRVFGGDEVLGEIFGDDPDVYAFFLTDVKVEGRT